jgi:hypothetical protein
VHQFDDRNEIRRFSGTPHGSSRLSGTQLGNHKIRIIRENDQCPEVVKDRKFIASTFGNSMGFKMN